MLLLAILLLLLTPLAMLIVRLARPGFAYHWLMAAVGALVAWPLVALSRLGLPRAIPLLAWQPESFFPASPALLVDELSWPYAMAVATLVLAVILTAVARRPRVSWRAWAGSLALGGFGLLAVLAGNPLTLLLAWAALDLVELAVLLTQASHSAARERVVVAFSARVAGIVLVWWAWVAARPAGSSLAFAAIPPQVSLYLILAAGLRLGVLPLHVPFLQEPPLRRGLGTTLRLVPAAASLVLLARVASVGAPENLALILLALTGLAALVGAGLWATADDELSGRPFWVLGAASLAVAAAIQRLPSASVAWGVALLFSGGLLFLFSARSRYLFLLPALGWLGTSALPYTPAWQGAGVYAGLRSYPLLVLFVLAHALLLAGYLRHALRPVAPLAGAERWVWVIYPFGLALLPATHILTQLPGFVTETSGLAPITGAAIQNMAGAISIGLALLLWFSIHRGPRLSQAVGVLLGRVFSLAWFYRLLWGVYRLVGRLIGLTTIVLEGEGGVLWAMVLLALLLSLLRGG